MPPFEIILPESNKKKLEGKDQRQRAYILQAFPLFPHQEGDYHLASLAINFELYGPNF